MKNKKTIWIIISSLIIVGFIFILIGFSTGTKKGVYFDITGFHIINGEVYEQKDLKLEEIKDIDIDVSYFDVIFEESDTYGIEIKSYDNNNAINWNIQNGTLKVNEPKRSNFKLICLDFSFLSLDKTSYIKIYLPKDAKLNNVFVCTQNSNIEVENLNCKDLIVENKYGKVNLAQIISSNLTTKMESGNFNSRNITTQQFHLNNKYGEIELEEIDSTNIKIQLKSGNLDLNKIRTQDIYINNKYGNIDSDRLETTNSKIELESGNVKLNGIFLGETDIYSSYGNVKLEVQKDKSYYNLNLRTKYGKIIVDDKKIQDDTTYETKESNGQLMKIVLKSGDMYINFNK